MARYILLTAWLPLQCCFPPSFILPSLRLIAHEECSHLRGTGSSTSINLSSLLCIWKKKETFVYASARRTELKDVPSESGAGSSLWCFRYFLLPEHECVQPRPAGTSALQGPCVLSRSSTDVQFPVGDFSQLSKHMSSPFLSSLFSFAFLPFSILSYLILFFSFLSFPVLSFVFLFFPFNFLSFPYPILSYFSFPFPFPSLSFSFPILSYPILSFHFLSFSSLSYHFFSFPSLHFLYFPSLFFPFISFSYPILSFLLSFPFLSFLFLTYPFPALLPFLSSSFSFPFLTSYKKSEKSLQEDIQLSPNPHLSKCPANRHIESKYLCMHTSPMDWPYLSGAQ